jgi:LmbE family N-acetylglucosaminyl deacetylase
MSEKRVYMVVFAHPDDAEFGCAGTVKKLTETGHAVYYACLTNGNVGSNDRSMTPERLAEIRHGEMEAAARRLGVKQVFFLDYGDTTLYPSLEMRGQVVRLLRQVKADIVFGMDPWLKDLTHIDHRTAAWVAIEAASNAGWHLAHYEQIRDEGLEPHPVQEIHLFYTDDPTHHVDITDVIEDRVESFLCHRSQIGFGAPQGEAFEKAREETAEWVRGAARDMGKQAGCAYAESFKVLEISGGHSQRAEAEG